MPKDDRSVRVTISLPESLRDRIVIEAEQGYRSVSNEIVRRLIESFERQDKTE